MNSRKMRTSFQPSLETLPSRIAPTIFTPLPLIPMEETPVAVGFPTTLAIPSDPLSTTPI